MNVPDERFDWLIQSYKPKSEVGRPLPNTYCIDVLSEWSLKEHGRIATPVSKFVRLVVAGMHAEDREFQEFSCYEEGRSNQEDELHEPASTCFLPSRSPLS